MKRFLVFILAGLMLEGCSGLFFYPDESHVRAPAALGLEYRDVWFDSTDGIKLHAWFLPARGQALGTVLFFLVNAENISTHIASVSWLPKRRFNVFLFDYRGYGKSEGSPEIKGLQEDGASAIQYLVENTSIDPNRLIVFGQSIGGAVAIYCVANSTYRCHIRALIVEGSFSGYRKIMRDKLSGFWLTWPLQWLPSLSISDKFSPISVVAKVTPIPLLIIHGENDSIVPMHHATRLYNAANEPKHLWVVQGIDHIEAFSQMDNRERLVAFMKDSLE